MAQWIGNLGFELHMRADYFPERVKVGERVFADEKTLPAPAPGSEETTKAWFWVERAIRPQTITRKNSLFAGSEGGGRTWATLAALLQTPKMNNVGPPDWLNLRH